MLPRWLQAARCTSPGSLPERVPWGKSRFLAYVSLLATETELKTRESPLFMPVFHSYLRKTRIKSGEMACNSALLM
jgi:hypothetical protein